MSMMIFSNEHQPRTIATVSEIGQLVKYVTGEHKVPQRTEEHEEFALCLFLIAGFLESKLLLPINVVRREAPDFRLTFGDERTRSVIGLEHTMGTTEKYRMDQKIFDEYPQGSLLELPEYSPHRRLPKKSRRAMRRRGEKLQSDGWGDYGMEKDWAQVMSETIKKKNLLLKKRHYEKFRSNELIIEDTSHVSSFKRLPESIALLAQKCSHERAGECASFDKVHIITEGILIYDLFGEVLETSIRRNPLRETWHRHTGQA